MTGKLARILWVTAVAAVIVLVGCSAPAATELVADPSTRRVTRADFGDDWPLTVESGTLSCQPGRAVVFLAPDGTAYGVNGSAADYEDIDPIWAENPGGPGPKKDIGPLITAGLALCD